MSLNERPICQDPVKFGRTGVGIPVGNVENGAQVQIPGGEKQNVPEQGKPLVFTLIEIFGLNCIKTAVEKDAAH